MRKSTKKGFTIVELVIVIAVIAILAAVLIPTFTGIIRKARESTDIQLIRNLNTAVATENALDGAEKNANIGEAVEAALDAGFDLSKIKATAKGNYIVWDSVNDVFCYFDKDEGDEGEIVYIPDQKGQTEVTDDMKFWIISDHVDEKYATYLTKEYNGDKDITTTVSLHLGGAEGITSVSYDNQGAKKEVEFYTYAGVELKVNAPNDNVALYGYADSAIIDAVANTSFYLHGTVGYVEIAKGRFVAKATAKVDTLVATSTDVNELLTETANIKNVYTPVNATNLTLTPTVNTVDLSATVAETVDTSDKDALKVKLETIKKAATEFAGGSGTEADPFLIGTAAHMANITKNYDKQAWYKVAEGVTKIDCTGLVTIDLNGTFDGNNVVFVNLTDELFNNVTAASVATVKNFTIKNCYIVSTTNYYTAPVVRRPQDMDKLIVENVHVSGYAEAIIVSGFVGYTEVTDVIEIVDCTASITLVSTGSQVSGFFGNGGNGAVKVIVKDSIYNGSMSSTASAGYYVCAHDCAAKLTLQYTPEFMAANANLHEAFPEMDANHQKEDQYTAKYSKLTSRALEAPQNVGDVLTIAKDDGAVRAEAMFVVGVNPGNYTRVCQYDEIDLAGVADSFTTKNVKLYNVVINDGVHGNEVDGNTLYLTAADGDGTYNAITFTVVQYDAADRIISISSCSIPGDK